MKLSEVKNVLNFTVLVSALGYFVDMYDLVLFNVLRVPSLKSLGISGDELVSTGVLLLNIQMIGMLLGGIMWGVLGDKKGRISVLFGSIFLYSVANIANAFVTTTEMYAVARFFSGIGLAGELGAAVTLVGESLPTRLRGYGTAIVAAFGILGSTVAAFIGDMIEWRNAFIIGGVLGFCLLGLRAKMFESGMYNSIHSTLVRKGDFISLFTSRERFLKYMQSIFIGLPTWFVVGVLITFSPEFGKALGVTGDISAARSVMFAYGGLVLGDIASGFISQMIGSRKKVVGFCLFVTTVLIAVYLNSFGVSPFFFYAVCFLLGIFIGYWAVFVTIASEQFGTNLRATVAISAPNFVRGAVVLIVGSFNELRPFTGIIDAAMIIGSATMAIAVISLYYIPETYHLDLNYLENYNDSKVTTQTKTRTHTDDSEKHKIITK